MHTPKVSPSHNDLVSHLTLLNRCQSLLKDGVMCFFIFIIYIYNLTIIKLSYLIIKQNHHNNNGNLTMIQLN